MRLAHQRPAAVALVAGGVLLAGARGGSLPPAPPSPATPASERSCEPLQLPAPSSSPSATPTTPTPTITTPTPTPSTTPATTPASGTTGSVTASPSMSVGTTLLPGQAGLCVAVRAAPSSIEGGQQAHWTVTAWAVEATVPAVTVQLQATPASIGTPEFSFGCGKEDGTATCALGAVDPRSARRQLRAQLTVPATASAVNSVSLTVTGTSPDLPTAPKASAAVIITAPQPPPSTQPPPTTQPASPPQTAPSTHPESPTQPAPSTQPPASTQPAASTPPPASTQPVPTTQSASSTQSAPITAPLPPQPPVTVTSPVAVGSLPNIPPAIPSAGPPGLPPVSPVPIPTQTSSGNAAGLFPTVSLSPTSEAGARRVADTSALPQGASVVGAQLVGLIALGLALFLGLTRLSVRRPVKQAAADSKPDAEGNHDERGAPGA